MEGGKFYGRKKAALTTARLRWLWTLVFWLRLPKGYVGWEVGLLLRFRLADFLALTTFRGYVREEGCSFCGWTLLGVLHGYAVVVLFSSYTYGFRCCCN